MATNEVNQPIFNINHTYYYGFQKKLNDSHYLISYQDRYSAAYSYKNRLLGWKDIYYCIYNSTANTVVSKLRVQSSDPILSYCEEKDGIYTIRSRYFKFIPEENTPSHNMETKRDSTVSKYRIRNNRFVQL
ncbi:hypothetical protein [Flavobacterium sp. Sd200]|uniref:hypothetical protein n=1 Tax=Flavobacterium sp. Sd200 TaxID=2692211 RepID=UPI001F2B7FCC|nr:hypothetical protein [Flavobacterium sp. Sd200]